MLPRAAVQSQGQWTLAREPFETILLRLGNAHSWQRSQLSIISTYACPCPCAILPHPISNQPRCYRGSGMERVYGPRARGTRTGR